MEEAAETGPMKMEGGKTREVELLFSRLPISRNYRDVIFTEKETTLQEQYLDVSELPIKCDAAACAEKATPDTCILLNSGLFPGST